MPTLNRYRRIWLYLPVDYGTATTRRYPVIYMHDGQNLFNAATSFAGEWEVDECLMRLHGLGDAGAIVVGIDNGGSQRIDEYSPWVHPQYVGGQGDAYLQFIVQTLKPYIDARYRTDSTRNGTWIWGSSMGGLISQYGAVKYQKVFSRVGVFSPSLRFDSRIMQQPALEGYRQGMRFYLLAGALERSSMVPQLNQLRDQLVLAGFPASQIQTVVKADGQHSEWFWRREFEDAYHWLKGQAPAAMGDFVAGEIDPRLVVYPQPCGPSCSVLLVSANPSLPLTAFELSDWLLNRQYQILDFAGRTVSAGLFDSPMMTIGNDLSPGIYRLRVYVDGKVLGTIFTKSSKRDF